MICDLPLQWPACELDKEGHQWVLLYGAGNSHLQPVSEPFAKLIEYFNGKIQGGQELPSYGECCGDLNILKCLVLHMPRGRHP